MFVVVVGHGNMCVHEESSGLMHFPGCVELKRSCLLYLHEQVMILCKERLKGTLQSGVCFGSHSKRGRGPPSAFHVM